MLPSLSSFEEYESLKSQVHLFENAAKAIIDRHQLSDEPLSLFTEGTNIVFAHGTHRVIKIFPPLHLKQFTSEHLVLKHLEGKLSVKTPRLEHVGTLDAWPYMVMSQLEGTLLETLWETMAHPNKLIILRELGALIGEVHLLPTEGLEEIDSHWEQFIARQLNHCLEHHRSKALPEGLMQELPLYLESVKAVLPQIKRPVLLTGEYTPMNVLVQQADDELWHITGLIDFGDAMLGLPEYDLLGPGAFLIQGDKSLLNEFLRAYGYTQDQLTPRLSRQLTGLMLLHQYSNLNVQIRIQDWQSKAKNLQALENMVWGFSDCYSGKNPSFCISHS